MNFYVGDYGINEAEINAGAQLGAGADGEGHMHGVRGASGPAR